MLNRRANRMLLSFLALGALGTAGLAFGSGFVVTLTPTGPQPPQVTAAIGDTVTFVNNDTVPHFVVARRDNLTTPTIPSGQTYAHVLTTSGNFTYRQEGGRDFPGTITVARTGGVSLAAKTRSIVFGASVELRGKAHPTGFPVTVQRRADTRGEYATLGTFVPGPDGAFSVKLRPRARTEYRASLLGKEFVSRGLVIEVRPGLAVRVSARTVPTAKTVSFTARLTPRTAARTVELMRLNPETGLWRRVATRAVNRATGTAVIPWQVEQGRTLLRLGLNRRTTAPGLAPVNSASIRVTGVGAPPDESKPPKRRQ